MSRKFISPYVDNEMSINSQVRRRRVLAPPGIPEGPPRRACRALPWGPGGPAARAALGTHAVQGTPSSRSRSSCRCCRRLWMRYPGNELK